MLRTFVIAVAAVTALAATMPAQALGPFFAGNGTKMNGLTLNGARVNGVATQEPTGGVSLLAIELPTEMR